MTDISVSQFLDDPLYYFLDFFILSFQQKNMSVNFLFYDHINHMPFPDGLPKPCIYLFFLWFMFNVFILFNLALISKENHIATTTLTDNLFARFIDTRLIARCVLPR